MWSLTIIDDEGKRHAPVPLSGDVYEIGRAKGNAIRLSDRNISRWHARMVRSGAGFVVEDGGSANGTYVNRDRLTGPRPLGHGDFVQLGDFDLVVYEHGVADNLGPERGAKLSGLVLLDGPAAGAAFPLAAGKTRIGRDEEADLVVTHESVSRQHCVVAELSGDRFEVADTGSTHGVVLNGQAIDRSILLSGDVVQLGEVSFRFVQAERPEAPAELASSEPPGAGRWRETRAAPLAFAFVVLAGSLVAWTLRP